MPAQPVVMIGMGGHARVLLELLRCAEIPVAGYVNHEAVDPGGCSISFLGDDDCFVASSSTQNFLLVNGVGGVKGCAQRARVFEKYRSRGYRFATLIHPNAVVAQDAVLGEGSQVMAGVVIQPGVVCGENVIINTRAGIDHDCVVGNQVHISVGATLAGAVKVGDCAFIGASATVIQEVCVGSQAVVGAGAVVLTDVAPGETVVGIPARRLNR